MSKERFLSELREYLSILEDQEQEDILAEYAQHIDMKMLKGLSEEEALAAVRAMTRASLMGAERLLTRCSVAADGSSGCRLLDMDRDTRIEVLVTRMDAGSRRRHQISLQMVVRHYVVAGI